MLAWALILRWFKINHLYLGFSFLIPRCIWSICRSLLEFWYIYICLCLLFCFHTSWADPFFRLTSQHAVSFMTESTWPVNNENNFSHFADCLKLMLLTFTVAIRHRKPTRHTFGSCNARGICEIVYYQMFAKYSLSTKLLRVCSHIQ